MRQLCCFDVVFWLLLWIKIFVCSRNYVFGSQMWFTFLASCFIHLAVKKKSEKSLTKIHVFIKEFRGSFLGHVELFLHRDYSRDLSHLGHYFSYYPLYPPEGPWQKPAGSYLLKTASPLLFQCFKQSLVSQ